MSANKMECTRMLRCVYTDAERLELGKQLADEHADLRGVNSDFDRCKAEFKSKITSHEAKIEDLSNKVSTGYRMETVNCRWIFDLPNKGVKTLMRQDTHEEVEKDAMSEADLQEVIDFAQEDTGPALKAAAAKLVDTVRKAGATMTMKSGGQEVTVK